jgi:DNA polymerase III sliding clamp (beta) subunit (PCNA family)
VNAKVVIELVKRMPKVELTFTQQDNTVTVNYGERGRAKLQVLSSEQYPVLPRPQM